MSIDTEKLRDVKDEARERLTADLEHLKKSFSQLKGDVAHLLKTSVGAGKASVHSVRDQAGDAVGEAREKLHDLTGNLKDKGQEKIEHIGDLVSERPLTSALVAFGVGFVIAKILSR